MTLEPLDDVRRLAEAKTELERRIAEAVRQAHDEGHSLREIAEAAGLSHMTIKRMLE